jgi:2-oxoglutarate dehydrogenase complex dehydrogenase (E1) component-like enzyme
MFIKKKVIMMEEGVQNLLEQMIQKINAITQTLDGTTAQLQSMNNAIQQMSSKFSEETVSLTENIRLIVEVLKQFRVASNKSINDLSKDLTDRIQEVWEKKSIEAILVDEKKAIQEIRKAEKTVANNLYYTQLLTIIRSIREETYRIINKNKS